MIVKHWMTADPLHVTPETRVTDAAQIMRDHKYRQMPVLIDGAELVGIVSDRDVRDAMPSKFFQGESSGEEELELMHLRVKEIMTPDPVTISANSTVETAARILQERKIGGLPVLDQSKKLVGIITEVDVLAFLCSVTGVTRPSGIQLVFEVKDTPEATLNLVGFLKDRNIKLFNLLTSNENVPKGLRHVSVRIEYTDDAAFDKFIEEVKDRFPLIYYVHGGRAISLQ